jgi:hypothetical protein
MGIAHCGFSARTMVKINIIKKVKMESKISGIEDLKET